MNSHLVGEWPFQSLIIVSPRDPDVDVHRAGGVAWNDLEVHTVAAGEYVKAIGSEDPLLTPTTQLVRHPWNDPVVGEDSPPILNVDGRVVLDHFIGTGSTVRIGGENALCSVGGGGGTRGGGRGSGSRHHHLGAG